MSRSARVQVVKHAIDELRLLRQSRAHRVDGGERDLRAFVQVDRAELGAEDLFDALLVVQAAEPDFALVGQRENHSD